MKTDIGCNFQTFDLQTVISPEYPDILGQLWLAFQPMRIRVTIQESRFLTKQYFPDGERKSDESWSFDLFIIFTGTGRYYLFVALYILY